MKDSSSLGLKGLKQKLSKSRYIALNGIRSPDPFKKVIDILFNGSSLRYTSGNDFISSKNKLNEPSTNTVHIIDMTNSDEEEIAQIFTIVRDIQTTAPDKKIIFFGDWSHHTVQSIIKGKAVSYPFTLENNELYTNRIRFSVEDFETLRPARSFDRIETWEILLDFTQGEFFSTVFFFDKLDDLPTLDTFDAFFKRYSFDLYQEYLEQGFFSQINDNLSIGPFITSFYCSSPESEDIINRSNLFEKTGRTGKTGIYIPINFFTKYKLRVLCDTKESACEPSWPILFKSKEVLSGVMEIERTIKHLFSQINEHFFGKGLLQFIPLYSSIINPNRIKDNSPSGSENKSNSNLTLSLKTGNSLLDAIVIQQTNIWQHERTPYDCLFNLTFGQLIRLLRISQKTFFINQEFNLSQDLSCVVQSLGCDELTGLWSELSLKNGLNLNPGEILSICPVYNRTKLNVILRWSSDPVNEYFSVKEKNLLEKLKALEEDNILTTVWSNLADTNQLPFLEHFEDFITALEEVKNYRNAITHMKVLSSDAYDHFLDIRKQLYRTMAHNG